MTRRHDIEQHRQTLGEIREIMNSMKTLAYMETRKLDRYLIAQRAVAAHIKSVATDFLAYHPYTLPESDSAVNVFLLIGSERGFCGDFNETILHELDGHLKESGDKPLLVLVGQKLGERLEGDSRVIASINGASVAEEVEQLLYQLTELMASLQAKHKHILLNVFYHDPDVDEIIDVVLLPPFQQTINSPARFPYPPVLNLTPKDFLADLIDQYLFAALHEIVFTSLMAENHQRIQHLEGAIHHLDDKSTELLRKGNALRQEEITEEIEVILLNTTRDDDILSGTS